MKQKIIMMICVCAFITGMVFIAGCEEERLYNIDLPDENSIEGYDLYIETIYQTKDLQKNEYRITENSSF